MNATTDRRAYRLTNIDFMRGLVIVIMALDHARDFFHGFSGQDPMNDPNIAPELFFTRWVTHFCAPVFVLLAGTSAGLMASRKTSRALGGFLLKRGLWLIAVEWFVISTAFTFSPFGIAQMGGLTPVILQVIWAIGASMVLLAGAQFFGRRACLVLGLVLVVGHNLVDPFWPASDITSTDLPLWASLHTQMSAVLEPFLLVFVYPLPPWFGVMLIGYGAVGVFEREPRERDAWLLRAGITMTLAFIILRALDVYGDPNGWQTQSTLVGTTLDFLNTSKYPPSLLFLLMTLGPMSILCAFADRWHGWFKDTMVMFGRVPFAFYVAHFYVLHLLSVGLGMMQGFQLSQMWTFFIFYPEGYGFGLVGVYLVWAVVMLMLYPFCRAVAGVKARRRDWWLSYV